MEVVMVFLHCIMCRSHVVKKITKLALNPFVVLIHFLVKTKKQLMASHHTRRSVLRIWLGCICSRIMSGRVIIGGIRCSFRELTIQWTNTFIDNSWCLALLISLGICPLEDFNLCICTLR